MPDKKLLFSVTKDDFDISTFSVGGHGGGGKDTSNSAVRLTHRASGAVGVGKEYRTNHRNRISAFEKLIATARFQNWFRIECAKRSGRAVPETSAEIRARVNGMVDEGLRDGSILVETPHDIAGSPHAEKGEHVTRTPRS